MTEHEKYQEHIRHTHDAFCKTVIRHAAIDAARSIRSRRKREISLEYLIEEKHYPFSTTDKYFAEQSGMTSYPLFVCGQMVLLESPELAAALSALSQMEQEIIFLYYFQRLTHREIGRRYGRAGNTTGRRIQMILRRLRAELEGLSYEPAYFPMRQSLRQARATRKLLPPSYPIMRDMSALVRKWTDRLTRICRSISSGN